MSGGGAARCNQGARRSWRYPPSRGGSLALRPVVPTEDSSTDSAADLARNAVEVLPEGALAEQLRGGRPLRVKLGIDPTAPDIHLGHTVVLQKLREFQDAGHTVVLIIGDFTARVGDPSGRSAERPLLEAEVIDANAKAFQEQAFKLLDPDRTEVRFNSEWLRMEPEQLFGLLAKTTVARLLEREDFRKRMESGVGISGLELLYPLLQGYDSVAVEADVELGGTDQKFNLLFGRDVQGWFEQPPQSILTMPILPGTDGVQRMSKSAGNYVGLADPPEEMFGKLMRIPDETMPTYYSLLLGREQPSEQAPNEAKRALARRLVERYHGERAAAAAEEHFNRLHVRGELPEEIEEVVLDGAEIDSDGAAHLPAALAALFGISRGEGRRLIAQGGVRIDGRTVDADELDVAVEELNGAVVQVGKRQHRRVKIDA
jgi:tyrosyl-tRNA synthetase